MPIGTATPTKEELRLAPHYFIATHEITEQYSAGRYELEVMECLEQLFREQPVVILCGGSMPVSYTHLDVYKRQYVYRSSPYP